MFPGAGVCCCCKAGVVLHAKNSTGMLARREAPLRRNFGSSGLFFNKAGARPIESRTDGSSCASLLFTLKYTGGREEEEQKGARVECRAGGKGFRKMPSAERLFLVAPLRFAKAETVWVLPGTHYSHPYHNTYPLFPANKWVPRAALREAKTRKERNGTYWQRNVGGAPSR